MSNLLTKKALSLEAAKEIAEAAAAEAKKNQWTMVICIVDDGGHLIYLERMDGTQIGSVVVGAGEGRHREVRVQAFDESARRGDFGRPDRSSAGPCRTRCPSKEASPIIVEGQVIEAIGVSGGTSQQDAVVGTAGLKVLG